mmetsp:Transcript_27035/g.89765  ORF Transcript_27035/g.89765 Transcript_27035/m.89765 type:complete len:217 (+) Transcript_27035:1778-2428(+)
MAKTFAVRASSRMDLNSMEIRQTRAPTSMPLAQISVSLDTPGLHCPAACPGHLRLRTVARNRSARPTEGSGWLQTSAEMLSLPPARTAEQRVDKSKGNSVKSCERPTGTCTQALNSIRACGTSAHDSVRTNVCRMPCWIGCSTPAQRSRKPRPTSASAAAAATTSLAPWATSRYSAKATCSEGGGPASPRRVAKLRPTEISPEPSNASSSSPTTLS